MLAIFDEKVPRGNKRAAWAAVSRQSKKPKNHGNANLLPAYQNSNMKAFQNIQRRKSWSKLYLCNPTLVLHWRANLIVPKTYHSQACNVLNDKKGKQFERKGKNKPGITRITGNNLKKSIQWPIRPVSTLSRRFWAKTCTKRALSNHFERSAAV